jgi:ABC-2 type transport system permease protein
LSALAIAAFELKRRRGMLSSYVYATVLFACGVLAMLAAGGAFASVSAGLGADKVHANAPEFIHGLVSTISHFGLLITAAVFGQAVHQDVEAGFAPILFTTGMRKGSYLVGRFLGAFAFVCLVFASISLGLWFGSLMPFLEPTALGPNRAAFYLWPYVVTVLPNVLLTGAIFFSLAVSLRSMTPVYVGGVVLLIGYLASGGLLAKLEQHTLAGMLDPFGFHANDLMTRYWTAAERNTQLVPLRGLVLANRLTWGGLGLGLLVFAYRRYRFGHAEDSAPPAASAPERLRRPRGGAPAPGVEAARAEAPARDAGRAEREPGLRPPSSLGTGQLSLLGRLTWLSLRETIRSVYFGVIVLAGVLFLVIVTLQLDVLLGTPTYPVTRSLCELIGGAFSPFMLIIIAFYAGDLTFRERDARIDSIIDALPLPTALPFLSKLLSLLCVPVLLQGVVMLTCLVVQTAQGYHHYELGLYLRMLFGIHLVDYLLLGVLCLTVHALVQNKYVGHFVVVLYYVVVLFLRRVGFEHNLYIYRGVPGHPYSDMNGFGHLLIGVRWFRLYWALFTGLLGVAAYLAWQRGAETTLRARWRRARERWTRGLRLGTAALAFGFVLSGAFIFYNTNVLNRYETAHTREQSAARYEQQYKTLEAKPQPRVTDVWLELDLFPETTPPSYRARGRYALKNASGEPIRSVYVNLPPHQPFDELRLGDVAAPTLRDEALGFYGFELAQPLEPDEATLLTFDVPFRPLGFPNGIPDTSAVENGTFFSNFARQPLIGYQPSRELTLDNERKKYGLAPRERMPPLEDERARLNHYISNDSDFVHFAANVSTAPDQIALAPGYLQREWMQDGRRHFEYAMDSPILNFYSVLSARYQVRRDRWRDVALEIYYQPGHEYNLDRMMQSMKDTLDYCTSHFSPYQHRQARIIEFPRYMSFAQSFPNTIPYSEAVGFIAKVDPDDPDDVDYPYYITAHEIAHQWWAHQVVGGNVQGATFLSESMAQYTALMVMKARFGPRSMKRFLRYELDQYLRSRGTERKKELPLSRVENQGYIHYNKGSLVMYALQDYIGEENVNQAARAFLDSAAFEGPPYPTSLELIGFIREQTPPELAYLLDDMFEQITLFDNRARTATYRRLPDGRYELKLAVSARKLRADADGVERDTPLADQIEVGVVDENGVGVALEKRWIRDTDTELTLTLDAAPARAGIDPLNKLVDRNPDDNVIAAVEASGADEPGAPP